MHYATYLGESLQHYDDVKIVQIFVDEWRIILMYWQYDIYDHYARFINKNIFMVSS